MNRQKTIFFVTALALMGGTAALLARLGTDQELSPPGVKASAVSGSPRMEIHLPQQVLDCFSEAVEPDEKTMTMLPKDTSIAQRSYQALDGARLFLNVVLMGTDRTSIHKARYCLEGQGMQIDPAMSGPAVVRMERPQPYDLPVMKLVATVPRNVRAPDGQIFNPRLVYVYWFVAEDAISADASGFERMWSMARKLLLTGKLQRWAYVSCAMHCAPGQEDAAFERIKKFLAASVPEFQVPPGPGPAAVAATRP